MNEEPIQVNIRILDKDYRIACEPHEQEGLHESARLLDGKMREIRQTGRVIGTDRIAVMAALNIAHDLVQLQKVTSIQDNLTLHDPSGWANQAHDGQGQRGLAAAGLAHQRKPLARLQCQIHAAHGLDCAVHSLVVHLQIIDLQDRTRCFFFKGIVQSCH